jgi:hypothetical protein
MTERPTFSADPAGVIRIIGWGDPSTSVSVPRGEFCATYADSVLA